MGNLFIRWVLEVSLKEMDAVYRIPTILLLESQVC